MEEVQPLLPNKELDNCILALEHAWSFGKARRIAEQNIEQWFRDNKNGMSEKDLNLFLLALENYYFVSDITKFLRKAPQDLIALRSKGRTLDFNLEKYPTIQKAAARIDRSNLITEAFLKSKALGECGLIISVVDPLFPDVNAKDPSGSTLLHRIVEQLAPEMSDEDIINIFNRLKARGADFNARNNKGETPLHIAVRRNLTRIDSEGKALIGGAVFVLMEHFAAISELANNKNQTSVGIAQRTVFSTDVDVDGDANYQMVKFRDYIKGSGIHCAIEGRNVDYFNQLLTPQQLSEKHPILQTPIECMQKLLKDYEDIKYLRTPRQWYRNRQLKKMLRLALDYVLNNIRDEVLAKRSVSEASWNLLNQFSSEVLEESLWRSVVEDPTGFMFGLLKENTPENYVNIKLTISRMREKDEGSRSFRMLPVRSDYVSFTEVAPESSGQFGGPSFVQQAQRQQAPSLRESAGVNNPVAEWARTDGKVETFNPTWLPHIIPNSEKRIDERFIDHLLGLREGWKCLFSAAINSEVKIQSDERLYCFMKVLTCLELSAKHLSASSEVIQDLAAMMKGINNREIQQILIDAFRDANPRPRNLTAKLSEFAQISEHGLSFENAILKALVAKIQVAMADARVHDFQ